MSTSRLSGARLCLSWKADGSQSVKRRGGRVPNRIRCGSGDASVNCCRHGRRAPARATARCRICWVRPTRPHWLPAMRACPVATGRRIRTVGQPRGAGMAYWDLPRSGPQMVDPALGVDAQGSAVALGAEPVCAPLSALGEVFWPSVRRSCPRSAAQMRSRRPQVRQVR